MNFPFFISKRIIRDRLSKDSISKPIITVSISSIAIGIIVMIIAIASGYGLQKEIRNKMIAISGHVQLSRYDLNNSYDFSPINLTDSFIFELAQKPEYIHIQKSGYKTGIAKNGVDFSGIILKGMETPNSWGYIQPFLSEGMVPDLSSEKASKEVVISATLARQMNYQIGDKIDLYFINDNSGNSRVKKFTITGLYELGVDTDNMFVFCDLRQIQNLNNWNEKEFAFLEVYIEDYANLDLRTAELSEISPFDIQTKSVRELYPDIFLWTEMFDTNIYILLVIISMVASINMISALLITILERTQMVGVLKSIGLDDWGIRKIFIYNAFYLILRGLFWGNLIGISFCIVQYYWHIIPLDASTYYVSYVPVSIGITEILLLNLGTLLICALILVGPSYFVKYIQPVKALNFE